MEHRWSGSGMIVEEMCGKWGVWGVWVEGSVLCIFYDTLCIVTVFFVNPENKISVPFTTY